jgi:3-methyl-2-oxobutanoate hydroxymethyltransferase
MTVERVTAASLRRMKEEGRKVVVITAYDYETARIVERAGADAILVGDSGGKYLLGHADFNAVTMDEMVLLTRSARRGASRALVVGDLPFMSYQVNPDDAVRNAGRLLKEANADGVKLEGGAEFAETVRAIVRAGIPVMGHMGLTPQTAIGMGGYLAGAAPVEEQVRRDALALQDAGVFAVVFTRVPPALAAELTRELRIPTLAGGGAGDDCDGQVCVLHSVFGLSVDQLDAPTSRYGPLARPLYEATRAFVEDVRAGRPVRSEREARPASSG